MGLFRKKSFILYNEQIIAGFYRMPIEYFNVIDNNTRPASMRKDSATICIFNIGLTVISYCRHLRKI